MLGVQIMKKELQDKAKNLRAGGLSIKNIAELLCVSPASVSSWTKNIILTIEQSDKLYSNQLKGAQGRANIARKNRIQFRENGKIQAQKMSPLHIQGCMLYWAEGRKHKTRCQFTNSDPHMIKLYIKFLREELLVEDSKIILNINCYTNNEISIEDIETYWLTITNLQSSNLRKSQVNVVPKSSKQLYKNKLIYGVCVLTVNSVEIAQHIFGAIQEYIKTDELIFLD